MISSATCVAVGVQACACLGFVQLWLLFGVPVGVWSEQLSPGSRCAYAVSNLPSLKLGAGVGQHSH